MIPTIFLEDEEIAQLTNRLKKPAQVRVLNAMGIEHKVRPDGSIVILRAHIIKVFDGADEVSRRKKKIPEPNWDAITARRANAA